MIDIKLYEKSAEYRSSYRQNLKNRGENTVLLEQVLELNQKRRKSIFDMEQLIVDRKKIEKDFMSKKDKKSQQQEYLKLAQSIGVKIDQLKNSLRKVEEEIEGLILRLPNQCHLSVPVGFSSNENVLVHTQGEPPSFSFSVKSHLELGDSCIDIKRASKVSGARFSFLRGSLAQLERALAHYMLDVHTKQHGYEELHTPFIVSDSALTHTGQLPKFKEDLFAIEGTHYYLIPTGEVPLTQFFSDETLLEKDLPVRLTAYTPCFRSEAGAYGKDTKGLIRQHQFTKVELVIMAHPEKSYDELEKMRSHAERILKDLEIHYRVMSLCTGDLGFSAAKCYDIEVWIPSENVFREISSCSNCEDYQARRGSICFRLGSGKKKFVHTLNGSGLAVGRTLIAVLENYQNEDGSVRVPKVLQPYMDGRKVILNK